MDFDDTISAIGKIVLFYVAMVIIIGVGSAGIGLVLRILPIHQMVPGSAPEAIEKVPRSAPDPSKKVPSAPDSAAPSPETQSSPEMESYEREATDTGLLVTAVLLLTAGGLYFGRRQLQMSRTGGQTAKTRERLTRVRSRSLDLLMRDRKMPTDFLTSRVAGGDGAEAADPGSHLKPEKLDRSALPTNPKISNRLRRLQSQADSQEEGSPDRADE